MRAALTIIALVLMISLFLYIAYQIIAVRVRWRRRPKSLDPMPWRNEAWLGTPFHRSEFRMSADDIFDPRPVFEQRQERYPHND